MDAFTIPQSVLPCTDELAIEVCDSPERKPAHCDDLVVDLGPASTVESSERPDLGARYARVSLEELRGICRLHSLQVRGTKQELVQRLSRALG